MSLEVNSTIPSAELAISNISWPNNAAAHRVAMEVLAKTRVNAIDIAPMMVFPDIVDTGPDSVDRDELAAFRRTLRRAPDFGDISEVRVAGFQGVTFGRRESIFSNSNEERDALVHHMKGIVHLAELVGAQTIVYGCLGTRLFDNQLTAEEVEARAVDFFTQLDPIARTSNVTIGIEPVSGARAKEGTTAFGRSGIEVVDFVSKLRSDYCTTHIKFLPDSFGMHDGRQEVGDVAKSVRAAFELSVLAPHAQMAEPDMAAPAIESKISDTHASLDIALETYFAPEASRRASTGNPSPALAIEMFPEKGITLTELVVTLNAAISAARYHYSKTLGV